MSIEAGLSSTEVAVIKEARKQAKTKVTKISKSLNFALVQETDGSFIYSDIDKNEVANEYAALVSSYDTFQVLHERFVQYCSPEDDARMLAFTTEQETYETEVATSLLTIKRKYNRYKQSLEAVQNRAQIENKLSSLKKEVL